jgi:hypothetical protein
MTATYNRANLGADGGEGKMLVRRLALAMGLLFALIGVQGPEFAEQYRQRLAGAIDELTRVVAAFDANATRQSLTPETAIQRLKSNPDPLARDRGLAAETDMARLARMQDALSAMKGAAPVKRLWALAENFDPEIAVRAFADYQPAAPTTGEAFVIGAIFGALGWAATHLGAWPIRRHIARRRERAAEEASLPQRGRGLFN